MKKWCDHCKKTGHAVDECFKLIGYPEWFGNPEKGKTNGGNMKYAANVGREEPEYEQDDPLEMGYGSDSGKEMKPDGKLVSAVVQEMMKLFNTQQASRGNNNKMANFAGIILASNVVSIVKPYDKNTWIIDSGASDHMCGNKNIFHNLRSLDLPL